MRRVGLRDIEIGINIRDIEIRHIEIMSIEGQRRYWPRRPTSAAERLALIEEIAAACRTGGRQTNGRFALRRRSFIRVRGRSFAGRPVVVPPSAMDSLPKRSICGLIRSRASSMLCRSDARASFHFIRAAVTMASLNRPAISSAVRRSASRKELARAKRSSSTPATCPA